MPPTGDQRETAPLQEKRKIKLLELNKSIPVGKGGPEEKIWPGWALGRDLGTLGERGALLMEAEVGEDWETS